MKEKHEYQTEGSGVRAMQRRWNSQKEWMIWKKGLQALLSFLAGSDQFAVFETSLPLALSASQVRLQY